jgi:hypothetical protein
MGKKPKKESKSEPKKEKKDKFLGETLDSFIQSIRDIKGCLERQGMDFVLLKVMKVKTKTK